MLKVIFRRNATSLATVAKLNSLKTGMRITIVNENVIWLYVYLQGNVSMSIVKLENRLLKQYRYAHSHLRETIEELQGFS